jgi:GTP pyrophosphokinase
MNQSMAALGFARDAHKGQKRKGSDLPYIVHPLSMACYALAIGIRDDATIAGVLLHDTVEDSNVALSSLPVGDEAREIVDCMTIVPFAGESKWACKERYFRGLLKCKGAIICKGLDRYDNLKTMEGDMPLESIEKNVVETSELLLPRMGDAKAKWPELSDVMFVLRDNLRAINNTLSAAHGISERKAEIIKRMMETPAIKEQDHIEW